MLIITPDIQTNTPPTQTTKPTKWILLSILTITITIVAIFQMDTTKPDNDLLTLRNLETKLDEGINLTKEERLTYCKLLQEVRKIFLNNCESLDFQTVFSSGRIISQTLTKKDCGRIDYLFQDKNKALNWARENLGHNTKTIYDLKSGITKEWISPKGDKVYWNHGDWGRGPGSSKFPHLNYSIGKCNGHLFLKDKIVNRGQWQEFAEYFNL